ncbi:MAG: hypothetical protein ACOZHQ_13755 [Thermodesulfobacteriota bacterium]
MRSTLAGAALLLALVLAAACSPQGPSPAEAEPAQLRQAQARLDHILGLQRRVALLCDLAGRAAGGAPDLALECYRQAQAAAALAAGQSGQVQARELRAAAQDWPTARRERAQALAAGLDEAGDRVWPLALVAEGVLGVDPVLAAQVMQAGLDRLSLSPAGPGRDQDLARLALVAARWDQAQAGRLAEQVGDPLLRSFAWRQLARPGPRPQALAKAVLAARRAAAGPGQARALAHCGLLQLEADPAQALDLFEEAFALAGRLEPGAREMAQGQVALLVAGRAPQVGLDLARRLPAASPERVAALRLAGLTLMGGDRLAGERTLAEAAQEAGELADLGERLRAASQLVQDLAGLDLEAARALLARLPRAAGFWRGQAQAALVPALAARDWDAALELAQGIADPGWRAQALARLASIGLRREAGQGRALADQALAAAQAAGQPAALAGAAELWAAIDARKGVDIALSIGENVARVRALVAVARVLARTGRKAPAAWALHLAEDALSGLSGDQAIDKVRLLGDMGQEWSAVDEQEARRFFRLGAEIALAAGPAS